MSKPPDNNGNNQSSSATQRRFFISAFAAYIMGQVVQLVLQSTGLIEKDSPEDMRTKTFAQPVSWKTFVEEMLSAGEVSKIIVTPDIKTVYVQLHRDSVLSSHPPQQNQPLLVNPSGPSFKMQVPSVAAFENSLREIEQQLGVPANQGVLVQYSRPNPIPMILTVIVTFVAVYNLPMFKKGSKRVPGTSMFTGMFDSVRKAQFRVVDSNLQVSDNLKVKFADVVGLREPKIEIQEFVEYLKIPGKYTSLGARLPKGALLLGPPGCGKTLLAKAVASEANVPFLATNGTEFIEMIGGLGAARVRDLFKEAKRRAPCMIYIDEIDAIGRKRAGNGDGGFSGVSEQEHTLNQLLVEMDGMDSAKGIVIIASTNRADILDKALLRRGRFDRHIDIDLPTLAERQEIFEYYLRKIKIDVPAYVYAPMLAKLTPGFSGADINNVCNEAAIKAATEEEAFIKEKHIYSALDRVLTGPEKRSTTVSPEEKKVVAYHESGHALVGWLLKHTNVLLKVTIVPRTSAALGFAQYNPVDRKIYSEDELFDRICVALGGRAAEILVFASPTSGAQNDLTKVTKIAYDQVKNYGMSRTLGPLSFAPMPNGQMDEYVFDKPYSKKLDALIDQEANSIVARAYRRTESVLKENRHLLDTLAEALLKKETLTYDDIVKLIGPPRFGEKKKTTESLDFELPQPLEAATS